MKTIIVDNVKYNVVRIDLMRFLGEVVAKELRRYNHKEYGSLLLCKETGKAYILAGGEE